ncbi:alpha/beta hydrolase [Gordonia sp. CPCC 205515]|uniref:alpha/beta hydrolase family protein n=1 Tax=Gordonia sp. CPCC 205515 TaxID=3140791 RepID=UPI003AF3FCDA
MSPETAAHWRAMPPSRLLDCGMTHPDIRALTAATEGGTSWDAACEQLGEVHLHLAGAALELGHPVTAEHEYRSAAADFLFAQMAFNFDTERKVELYDRFTSCVDRVASVSRLPMQRIELPFGGGQLVGWMVEPTCPTIGTVVVFGGQSGWGAAYLRNADSLAQRGIATVLAEGPGQGESRQRFGVHLDVDVSAAYSEFVSYALARHDAPVGLWGNSMGGLYAALTAAADPRVQACCVNGGFAAPRLLEFRTFAEQAGAMLGTDDPARIEANFARLRFHPDTHHLTAPLLVLHGGADPLVDLADQQPFLDAAGDATLREWSDGDHTIYNHGDERNDVVADWFADRFRRSAG